MHRAPAVNYSVKRSRWQARFIGCVSLLALLTLAFFTLDQGAPDARTAVMVLAALVAGATAFWGWQQSPQGSLRWDGQNWFWSCEAGSSSCRLGVVMDFQRFVIVSIKSQAISPIFIWLEGNPGDPNWRRLRRAIVSSQSISDDQEIHADSDVQGEAT